MCDLSQLAQSITARRGHQRGRVRSDGIQRGAAHKHCDGRLLMINGEMTKGHPPNQYAVIAVEQGIEIRDSLSIQAIA